MQMQSIIDHFREEYRKQQAMAEKAISVMSDDAFFNKPSPEVNSVALIVKHVAGNLKSRWTDFLTTDGEKPNRNRDGEFIIAEGDDRDKLLKDWSNSFDLVESVLDSLKSDDLDLIVTIRGQEHSVFQAILRNITHCSYHVGQILYLSRLFVPHSPWLTIAPKSS
jgi:uncharacterized damage-inducible protein DinB